MREVIFLALAIPGCGLMLIAAIGVARMPDVFTRLQASTKAASLGAGLVFCAAAVHFGDFSVASRAVAAIAFLLLTAPVAAHLLGRAAYFVGIPLCESSVRDDLRYRYDPETHALQATGLPGEDRSSTEPDRRSP